MKNSKLTCEQIKALLEFYAENSLNKVLAKQVKKHLEYCKECQIEYQKYSEENVLKEEFTELLSPYINEQYENFKSNLSAYIDNELNTEDNIKIKKIVISNPLARKDLENIFSFKKLLHTSFEKTKNDVKTDFSKQIVSQLQEELKLEHTTEPFLRVALYFTMLILLLIGTIITILNF